MHERDESEEGSAYAALVLGTRDYVRKCGFKQVVLGLSGGIDSALTACIAVDALGAENVMGVAMPGPYSSRGSIDDARGAGAQPGHPVRDDSESTTSSLPTRRRCRPVFGTARRT